MIKVQLSELLNSVDALQKLSQTNLKARSAYYVSKLLKVADKEIQEFNDARMNLIKKYGEKDENGELITDDKGNCKILPENIADFQKELNDLLAVEAELNANKINLEELGDIEFTPKDISMMEAFIELDEDEDEDENDE